jgi:TolB-like protein/Tfp pilus assembly protein PilF
MGSIFNEFKRRHVFRVGLAYLVIAWLVLQVANILTPLLGVPLWVNKAILLLLVLGFPVAIFLAWAFELTPDGVKRTDTLDEAEPQRRTVSSGRKLDFVIIAGLIAALGYFVWHQYYGPSPSQTAEQGTALTPTSAAMPTLAVLPFANLSDDKKQDYFADGLSEELLDKLANLKGLQVAGRTSSFYFKGKNEDLRVIGEKLGVENLLEGSVRKSGDQLRITAQLINAKTGYHLWSETYDRALDDIFTIQDDISKSVANALSVALGVGDLGRIEGGTRNVAAYDSYLKALKPPNAAQSMTLFREQLDSLEQAVRLDPSYALAWVAISSVCRLALNYDDPGNAADWRKRADDALDRARALAPNAMQVLAESAITAADRGSWEDAERTFGKAIALHGDAQVAQNYGDFLELAGKPRKAVEYLIEARRSEPLDPSVAVALGLDYAASGMTGEALAEFERGIHLGGSPNNLTGFELMTAMATGDRDEIQRRIDAFKKINDITASIHVAMRPFLDKPQEGIAELKRLYAKPENAVPIQRLVISVWAAYFGDPDLALAAIKDMFSGGASYSTTSLFWQPVFHDMRKLPGFKDFVRERGLVDYWREFGWGDFCLPVGDKDFECD